jgi:hypothetical protein
MHCWSEGELRAYLDHELSSRGMERAAAHIGQCTACASLCAQLMGRAELVARRMEALPEPVAPLRLPSVPRRVPVGRRWVAGAAGLAAALAFGWMWTPRHAEKAVLTPPPPPPAMTAPSPAPPPLTVKPAIIRKTPRPRPAAKPKPQIQYYVALDNEPIETGLVVRVGLNGGQIPADVIVGPDGRARAIRLVSDISGEAK